MLGLFKKKLPHCDELFETYFSPWYPENDKPKSTRPDMYQIAAFEGQTLDFDELQYLSPTLLEDRKRFINITMTNAAMQDFGDITKSDKLDFAALDAVDRFYDRKKIAALISDSDPSDFSNPYVVTVCEFGVMLGQLFRQYEGYDWLYSDPYFHSIIVHNDTGFGITVFDWAIKKFSDYGVDDGFVAKIHAAIDGVNEFESNPNR